MPKIQNSTASKAPRPSPDLTHWVGPHQHIKDGVASDPTHESIPAGPLSSKQHREPNANK